MHVSNELYCSVPSPESSAHRPSTASRTVKCRENNEIRNPKTVPRLRDDGKLLFAKPSNLSKQRGSSKLRSYRSECAKVEGEGRVRQDA